MTRPGLVARYRRLSRSERRLGVRAVRVVAWVRLLLTIRSFAAADRATRAVRVSPSAGGHSPERIGVVVAAVSRYVPGATCLTQALAARVLLAQEGHSSELVLGMARVGARLRAHAWLEAGGTIVVGGGVHREFVPFEPAGRRPSG